MLCRCSCPAVKAGRLVEIGELREVEQIDICDEERIFVPVVGAAS
jgi:hypothetical protein